MPDSPPTATTSPRSEEKGHRRLLPPREWWLLVAARALLLGALALLIALGVRDVVRDAMAPNRGEAGLSQPRTVAEAFPRVEAQAYATQFALAYLTYDSDDPDVRQRALAPYISGGADAQAGWDGTGKQTATAAVPSRIDVHGSRTAEVVVAVRVDDVRWEYLAVPVAADSAGLLIAGTPALVPAPPQTAPPPETSLGAEDTSLEQQLQPDLRAFFAAWASGDATSLGYFEASGANLRGLGGIVRLVDLADLRVGTGGDTRLALATVHWRDAVTRATVTQTYRLDLVQQSGQWHVRRIEPATP